MAEQALKERKAFYYEFHFLFIALLIQHSVISYSSSAELKTEGKMKENWAVDNYVGIGAIVGDIVGSPYEFDAYNIKTENFPLFSPNSHFTDDTVMTVAVAYALAISKDKSWDETRENLIKSMTGYGKLYPRAGYGARFIHWFTNPVPYNSWGNGSAMRVSPAGWLYDSLEETLDYAKLTAEVSHNHPEGIKGAQAAAAAIFLTRKGMNKADLRDFITDRFAYDLSRTLDEIRPSYRHVDSCQETVPEAITAYLEADSFESVLRKAVSLGGDSDTLTDIAAAIGEAAYGIPDHIKQEALTRLDEPLLEGLDYFERMLL